MANYQTTISGRVYGKPCVGCGYCCVQATCMIGLQLFVGPGRRTCPALQWDEDAGRHWCAGMQMSDEIKEKLGAGAGCTSPMNTWRLDIRDRTGGRDGEE